MSIQSGEFYKCKTYFPFFFMKQKHPFTRIRPIRRNRLIRRTSPSHLPFCRKSPSVPAQSRHNLLGIGLHVSLHLWTNAYDPAGGRLRRKPTSSSSGSLSCKFHSFLRDFCDKDKDTPTHLRSLVPSDIPVRTRIHQRNVWASHYAHRTCCISPSIPIPHTSNDGTLSLLSKNTFSNIRVHL